MRLLLAPVVLLALAGCGPSLPTRDLPKMVMPDGRKPSDAKDWAKLAEHHEARAREARQRETLARQAETRHKLYWVSGLACLAALGCVALAIFLPAFRKQAIMGFLACVAIAAMGWLLAWLVPYLLWIGAGLVALIAGASIYYWRLDAKSKDQIIRAVEDAKPDLADYRDRFARYIDEDADRWIDKARKRLGLTDA